jgi:hypothetical protein
VLVLAKLQQQIELFSKQRVVVFEPEAEERKRFDRRTAADDHLRAPSRQQIDRREVLEDAHRVLRAQHRDGAGQPDALRARRGGAENHRWRGIEKLPAMVFTDAEDVQSCLVSVLDLLDELPETLGGIHGQAVLVECGGEAVNPNFHR